MKLIAFFAILFLVLCAVNGNRLKNTKGGNNKYEPRVSYSALSDIDIACAMFCGWDCSDDMIPFCCAYCPVSYCMQDRGDECEDLPFEH